ncbi:MAG: hypothetical protein IJI37_05920 [Opitutales bacterium]|nr:hypothetical protein [Opitutales bacterium]
MFTDDQIFRMGKRKLVAYLRNHPEEILELHERYNLKGLVSFDDLSEIMEDCQDFRDEIEEVLADFDYQDDAKEYEGKMDDGYDPDDYCD